MPPGRPRRKAESKFDKDNIVVTFKYDPLGRRIEKRIEDKNKKPQDATVITYVYDGQAIILQYEATPQKTTTTKFVHGQNIDEPLAMQRDAEVYFYHADGLGSITALTDSKQKTMESYSYDSFGNLKNSTKPMQPFTYTGRIWDAEIGLYDYRARTYSAQLGRFMQKDPAEFVDGSNVYIYSGNNPIIWVDPLGLASTFSGYATYYNLVGYETASGAMFDPNSMAAAMTKEKVPKLGTTVTVKYNDGGCEIQVVVNDRGPFARGKNGKALKPLAPDPSKIIDLTPTAFRALVGDLGAGKVWVTVEVP